MVSFPTLFPSSAGLIVTHMTMACFSKRHIVVITYLWIGEGPGVYVFLRRSRVDLGSWKVVGQLRPCSKAKRVAADRELTPSLR